MNRIPWTWIIAFAVLSGLFGYYVKPELYVYYALCYVLGLIVALIAGSKLNKGTTYLDALAGMIFISLIAAFVKFILKIIYL